MNFYFQASKQEWWSNIINERNSKIFENLLMIMEMKCSKKKYDAVATDN